MSAGLASVLGGVAACLVALLIVHTATSVVIRRKRSRDISSDADYVATIAMLSESSVRRRFDPYTDIDWDAPDFAITAGDSRWVLPAVDPLGSHPWYQAQPVEKQIAIGMWRQANIAKVSLQFENVLVRGLMNYAFWAPNGSPEYRYCLHESIEECNHTLMFQELVNRIGADVPGMPWWLRWSAPLITFYAGPMPNAFFFAVLAGEVPVDRMQTDLMQDPASAHPIIESVIAIHLAEEARHISFAHEYLCKRVPQTWWTSRFWLSLYVPLIMRVLSQAVIVPPRRCAAFDVPRSVRRDLFGGTAESRRTARDMFADIRMLCDELGLMNPAARLMWRLCKINGRPARYRREPQRAQLPAA